jgi:hypothetical protein
VISETGSKTERETRIDSRSNKRTQFWDGDVSGHVHRPSILPLYQSHPDVEHAHETAELVV